MKKILLAVVGGLMAGAFAVASAQAPAKPAAAAPKGPSAEDKAEDRAVANYRKNKGISTSMEKKPAAAMGMGAKDAATKK
jgi:hypothetical protein